MKTTEKITILFLVLLTAILIAVSAFLILGGISVPTAGLTAPVSALITKPSPKKLAQILFIGDIMLDRGIQYYAQKNGGNDFIFSNVHDELSSHDLVIANLEGPITDNESISIKAKIDSPESYFFTFDPSWAKTLYENNIRLVNLGNNHILNFGGSGLASAKNYLEGAGVDYFGAPDYPKSITREINGIKITFINYNEFSAYAEIEERAVVEEIQKAKEYSDIIIIFSHWGAEYIAEPSEQIKNLARKFIDSGADLVVGSHSHVIQSVEIYNGKRIYYSLGNFIFDQYFSEETRNGLGVILKISKVGGEIRLEFEEINFYLENNGQTIVK